MALSAIVTKKSVTNPQSKLYIIIFNLQVTDGVVVIDQDFTCEYRTGELINSKIDEVTTKMNEVIASYKAAQAIFNNIQLDNAVIAIQEGLNV